MNVELLGRITPAPFVFSPQQFKPNAGESGLVEDDADALRWAVSRAIATRGAVWLGGGKYRTTKPLSDNPITVPIAILGAGLMQCEIHIDPAMAGTALGFSNTWYGADIVFDGGAHTGQVVEATKWVTRKSGVTLAGFTVIGDRSTPNTQNGIIFYDRNDAVILRDVDVHFVKGVGLCLSGIPSNPGENKATVLREADVENCQVRWCGDKATARPAVMLNCSNQSAGDDGNNYNHVRMKAVFSDGLSFQNNTYNTNSNQASNNDIDVIIDTPQGLSSCLVSNGQSSVANGVLTVSSGGTITGALEVGQYVNNGKVPPGTYISAVLTGSGGVGMYQLAHAIFDLSAFSAAAGELFSLRTNIQYMQACGGHMGEKWKVTLNGSNMLGTGAVGIEFNQNCLSGTTPKTERSELSLSCGRLDVGMMYTVIGSLDVKWRLRTATVSVTALSITQGVSIDVLGEFSEGRLAIGGDTSKLHVKTGAQIVVTALPPANKYPNAVFLLNTAGVYTRHVSNGSAWVAF